MAEELKNLPDPDLLPLRQRVAWIALIWSLSVGMMVLMTLAVRSLIA